MIKINNSTTKQSLFRMLEDAAKNSGDLHILVESLPAFMSTRIALSIFSYQIDKYPRKIIWKSEYGYVLDLLESAGFTTIRQTKITPTLEKPETSPQGDADSSKNFGQIKPENAVNTDLNAARNFVKEELQDSNKKLSDLVSTSKNTNFNNQEVTTPQTNLPLNSNEENKQQPFTSSRLISQNQQIILHTSAKPNSSLSTQNSSQQISTGANQTQPNPTENQNDANSNYFNSWKKWFSSKEKLNLLNLTKDYKYRPSSLLYEKNQTPQDDQDLDQWIKKIKNTKSAIDNIRIRETAFDEYISQNLLTKRIQTKRQLNKKFYLFLSSVLTTCLLVLFLFVYPTNVYTVEIENPEVQSSTTVNLPLSKFSQKSITVAVSSTIEATGTKEIETTNATGKAILLNTSGNAINLTNGGFYLVNGGQKYKHEFDPNLPEIITIPSRNDLNGPRIEIKIRAVNPGSAPNLPQDTKFSIVNLQEKSLGNALFAISTTPIQNKEVSGDRVITRSDLDLLKTLNEGKIAQELGKEIAKLQNDNVFTNPDWQIQNTVVLDFDGEVGEIKNTVTLVTQSVNTLFFLPREVLIDLIKLGNPKIDRVTEIIIKDQSGNFESSSSQISLELFFSYTEKYNIDKYLITQTLSSETDFSLAEQQLKQKFPNIKRVEKKETGLNMPMINPKISINIVE